jgi:CheY-like chemotaxis protein
MKKNAPNWADKVVLVAEDEILGRKYLEKVLKPSQVKLVFAHDGQDAIEKFKSIPEIDLVLMDLKMPLKNGYQATSEIKAIKPNIPIIAQTAFAFQQDEQKALEAGCDDYVTKPITRATLYAKMIKYLGE